MRSVRIRFRTARNINFSKLGIPLEVFRKKRAVDSQDSELHFNKTTLKMLKSSNAHMLIDKSAK